MAKSAVTLDDKYELEDGRIFLTGVQALVRIAFDQHRADARAGLRTATFISGYQGSPLGTYDKELQRAGRLCSEHDVHLQPAVNEELGATSVWGSQLAPTIAGATRDGVVGFWYGKNPGLDRAADAIRHANYCGTAPTGGAVALVGDDPSCKSSTLPSAAEPMLAGLMVPVLWPGNVQEVLDLGLHAVALSRASGLWSSLKIVTNVADAAGTADVAPGRVSPVAPVFEVAGRQYVHKPNAVMLAPDSLISERNLVNVRLEIARQYSLQNGLNHVTVESPGAWLGIMAAGKTYRDLVQALQDLGLDEEQLRAAGVRVLKIGMPWPLEPSVIRGFADGLAEILVVEDKLGFLESQVRDLLYGHSAEPPRVLGKRDEEDRMLLPAEAELDADLIARAVASRLRAHDVHIESVTARIEELEQSQRAKLFALPVVRTPFFCSGCPHNSSTVAGDDELVGAGIGCHTMILLNPDGHGTITGITQMGGEGAQWIGIAPFTDREHFTQNLGDGTFHHSGSLAVRAAVASGVNITYKLFANGSVAMTGSQDIEGGMTVPELTQWFALEGVKRIVVTTEDRSRYDGVELAPIASLRDREDMIDVQRELAAVPGVTVLIHDQECAAERRRLRKRGKRDEPPERVVINERVCEGCGDCGVKSACLSVLPVDTEFGRKTEIHQGSCNKDYSCLRGDCPSFTTVIPSVKSLKKTAPDPPASMPDPVAIVPTDGEVTVRMIGIGGTGVVTVSQILSMAAHLEGRHSWSLDQTGLSQKGGPVISDIRISPGPIDGSNKASAGCVDLYLGFDLLGAANPKNLQMADPERTVAVVSTSVVPTGKMVIDSSIRFPALSDAIDSICGQTRHEDAVFVDAQALSERLFGDHMPGNMVLLGVALQQGALPVSLDAMRAAIELNGAGVKQNLAALDWGRACVAAPDAVAALDAVQHPAVAVPDAATELERLLAIRIGELAGYQNKRYAQSYEDAVQTVAAAEQAACGEAGPVSEAVARQLFKLMAYKDEYEVARLHLDPVQRAQIKAQYGDKAKVVYHLHPPLLRALGLKRKLKLGPWFDVFFRMLKAMRGVRGHWYDPFGRAEVRRVERALVAEYRAQVDQALTMLRPDTQSAVAQLCELPDMIRGYEDIKLGNVERWRERSAELLGGLMEGRSPQPDRPDAAAPFTGLNVR